MESPIFELVRGKIRISALKVALDKQAFEATFWSGWVAIVP